MPYKIKMRIKQTRWQDVEISEDNGYAEILDLNELVNLVQGVKDNPLQWCSDSEWTPDNISEIEIEEFTLEG